jgi:hypothetical protein
MSLDALKSNISQMKEIIRELYVFSNQLSQIKDMETNTKAVINTEEKLLLNNSIMALTSQLKILNDSVPGLVNMVKFYKELETEGDKSLPELKSKKDKFIQVKYKPAKDKDKIALAIDKKFKKQFLENLSRSNLSINKLKRKYSTDKPRRTTGKISFYAKISNRFFRNYSTKLIKKGKFKGLNKSLRKINAPFTVNTYISMILFTSALGLVAGTFLYLFLLFFNISILFPFITLADENILVRLLKYSWAILMPPILGGLIMLVYPMSEAKSIGSRINQELPFVTIHMSAIASSGIEPTSIFKILLKNKEYRYTNKSLRKIMNLINFHGFDLISALKQTARTSPSVKLRELLDGMATSMTSGGDLHQYLDKRAERLLFDYKLERESYTKASETFMNIYISVVIAAPMIFLMLFVIIGGTGMLSNFIGLSIDAISILIILSIVLLNIGFLVFLKLKQPVI